MAGIKDIIATQEKAAANFDKAVETSEKKIFDEVVLLIKDLETTPKGNIKTSISNLKRVQKIRTQLSKIANNKEYLKAVADLVGSFDKIYQQQLAFYAKKNQSTRSEEKKKLVQTIARENTIESLSGAGLATNVLDQIDNMLVKAVTTGVKFTDLQDQLHTYLVTDDKSQGALAKYAKTYAVTALSQYAGQNNKLFTEDLGTEWFEYVGSEIETTRSLCNALIKKRYIHKSEIPDILKGHIHIEGGEDIDVEIYPKTKLPYGMIEGTNADNFQVNVGGWNCRHQLIPVADAAVPENIRAKFDKKAQEEIAKKKAEEEKKKKEALILKTANNVLEVAKQFHDIDYLPLKNSIDAGDFVSMQDISKKIAKAVAEMKRREEALTDLIPNARDLHKTISIAELEQTHAGITKTLSRWDWDFNSPSSLKAMKDGLEYEIRWMGREDRGKKRYPKTWHISQEAYKKRLELVEHRISMLSVKDNIKDQIAFAQHSRSPQLDTLLDKFDDLFADDSTSIAQLTSAANNLAKKVAQLEAQKSRRDAKKVKTKLASDFTPKTAAETKKDFVDYMKSIGHMIDERDVVVDNGFIHFQGNQHKYIYEAVKPETQAEHDQLWNHYQRGGIHGGGGGYVQTGNSFYINRRFRTTKVVGKLDANMEEALKREGMTADDIKTIKLLDKKIVEFSLPMPIRVTRYVDEKALNSMFGTNIFTGSNARQLYKQLQTITSGKSLAKDPAYMSASTNEKKNVFTSQPVKLEIEVEPNTPMYLTNNYQESEVVFGRSTELVFLSAKDDGRYLVLRCRMKK